MTKCKQRLLILMAVVVTVAGLGGGWKWGDSSYRGSAIDVYAAAHASE